MLASEISGHAYTGVLILFVALLSGGPAGAATAVQNDGTCPRQVDLGLESPRDITDIFAEIEEMQLEGRRQPRLEFDNEIFGSNWYVARSDALWLTDSGNRGRPMPVPPSLASSFYEGTEVGHSVIVLTRDSQTSEFLVMYPADAAKTGFPWGCGWLDGLALTQGEAQTFEYLSSARNLPDRLDGWKSPLTVKVIAENNLAAARKGEGDDTGAELHAAPGDVRMGRYLQLFDINYVFDFEDVDNTTYLLVGGADADVRRDIAVLGWVDQQDVILWSTRVSAYFPLADAPWKQVPSVQSEPVGNISTEWYAFESPLDADDFVRGDRSIEPIAERPENQSDPADKVRPRFPIIEQADIEGLRYYAIAFPGARESAVPQPVTSQPLDPDEIRRRIDAARSVDVVFLIDGSFSMGRYFDLVGQALGQFMTARLDTEGDDPESVAARWRFAAYAFGDYETPSDARSVQIKQLHGFRDGPGAWRAISAVLAQEKEPFRSDPNKDKPEAVGAALQDVVGRGFRGQGEMRVVIVIGDHGPCNGSRGFGPSGSCPRKFAEPVTVQDVAKSLDAADVAPIFIAVRGEEVTLNNTQNHSAIKASRSNFEGFARALEAASGEGTDIGLPLQKTYDPDASEEEDSEVIAGILRSLNIIGLAAENEVQERVSEVRRVIQGGDADLGGNEKTILPPNFSDADRLTFLSLTRRFGEILDKRSLSEDEIAAAYASTQFVEVGWVPERDPDGKLMLDFWVALEFKVVEDIQAAARGICNAIGPDSDTRLAALYSEMFSGVSGTPEDLERPISELMEEKYSIPAEHLSRALNKSLKELLRWSRSAETPKEDIEAFIHDTCLSSAWLNSVLERRQPAGFAANHSRDRIRYSELREPPAQDFDWEWGTVSGARLFWVPVEMLP